MATAAQTSAVRAKWLSQSGAGPPSQGSHFNKTESVSTDLDDIQEKMEPGPEDTSNMNFVDGRCTCCPYGYHIDLDFLQYLENMNKGNLKNLKKIHRKKKELRKSMEVFLHSQETNTVPPPDVVNSTENFVHIVDQDETATHKLLEEIDSSVNATLSSIDVLYPKTAPHKRPMGGMKGGSFSEDDTDQSFGPSYHGYNDQKYRAEAELMLSRTRRDSASSLESQSTYSSEVSPFNSSSSSQHITTTTTITTTNRSGLTSVQLATNMANLLPDGNQVSSSSGAISPATLQAIREQMAISLQRMRELEEQVKTIPVLQIRINVLKEEKQLLGLQLKARNNKMNMRTLGVGDCKLDDDVEPLSPSLHSRFQTVTNINLSQLGVTSVPNGDLSRPPRPAMRSIGVGDANVFDTQMQLASYQGTFGTKYHEKEFHTEQNTEIREKEVKTVFLGQGSDSDAQLRLAAGWRSMDRAKKPEKPERPPRKTRSIGVGENDVFDASSNVHVHEKELRTVYIADEEEKKKPTRNVGILCKAAMRDVGVTYRYESEKPSMRNIAVGVGEIGADGEGYFMEGEEGGLVQSGSHTTHMSMNQMNLAAFHSRHIHINNEQLLTLLDTKLRKDLRSVGTMCYFPSEDKGVQHNVDLTERVTVGCGSDSVDVEVRPFVHRKSVGVENRPSLMNRLVGTDKGYQHDAATNTHSQFITKTKSTNTDQVVTFPAAVNTEKVEQYSTATFTDPGVFQFTEQIRTTGTNTPTRHQNTTGTNTAHGKMLTEANFDFDITFTSKGVNTEKEPPRKNISDRGINTETPRMFSRAVNTQGPKLVERGVNVTKPLMPSSWVQTECRTVSRGVGESQVKAPNRSTGTGDMSIYECENCHNKSERMRQVAVNTDTIQTKSVGSGYQSIREEGHMTEVTSDVYIRKLPHKQEPAQHVSYSITGSGQGDSVKDDLDDLETSLGGKSNMSTKVVRTVTTSSRPVSTGSSSVTRNVVVERRSNVSGGNGGESTIVEKQQDGQTASTLDFDKFGGNKVTRETVQTVRSSGFPTQTDNSNYGRNIVVETRSNVSGGNERDQGIVEDFRDGQMASALLGMDLENSGGNKVTSETVKTVRTSGYPTQTDNSNYGRNIVVETRSNVSGGIGGKSTVVEEQQQDGQTASMLLGMGMDLDNFGGNKVTSRETVRTVRTSGYPTVTETDISNHGHNVVVERRSETRSGSSSSGDDGVAGDDDFTRGLGSSGMFDSSIDSVVGSGQVTQEIVTTSSSSSSSMLPTATESSKRGRNIVVEHRTKSSEGGSGSTNGGDSKDARSGTQMRVVRHVETSYVGGRPVKTTSNVVLQDDQNQNQVYSMDLPDTTNADLVSEVGGSTDGQSSYSCTTSSSSGSSLGGSNILGQMEQDFSQDISLNNNNQGESVEYSKSYQPKGKGRRVVITETRIERKRTATPGEVMVTRSSTTESSDGSTGSLRSIMKHPGSMERKQQKEKKEISFSEDVVGGYVTSSTDDDDEEEGEADDKTAAADDDRGGSDSEGSQSSISYDEGSYDGRAGKIVYTCKDDQAIADGAPGAKMYDQNLRETYELSPEIISSCEIYAQWLDDSTQITTKQLNNAIATIQHEWFKVSSTKMSDPGMVEDHLTCLNEISGDLLQQVVNLADGNGNTALHYAVSHCNMEIVSLMLDTQLCDINKQNKAGYTAIMLASLAQIQSGRQRDIIRKMFNVGDVNARASQAGQTALMLAVSHGRQDMVEMLLEAGANVNTQDEDGSTALMCASEHGHTEIVKMLLGQPECDPTLQDNDSSTSLSIAMEAGHRDIGVLLYAHVNFKQGSPVLGRGKGKRRTPSLGSPSPTSPSLMKR